MPQNHPLKPSEQPTIRLAKITLRVRDLAVSGDFYGSILGCRETTAPGDQSRSFSLEPHQSPHGDVIELLPGRSIIGSPLESFSVEACSPEDVDEIYLRLRKVKARAIPPRTEDGQRRCVVFDPDGCRIEIFANETGR